MTESDKTMANWYQDSAAQAHAEMTKCQQCGMVAGVDYWATRAKQHYGMARYFMGMR